MDKLQQHIRERAYAIWEFRQQHGMLFIVDGLGNIQEITEQDDWFEAEDEVKHAERFHKQYHIRKESEK